ncbi:PREDICTED: cyclin-L1 [Ceratosolen solmsi marchali]|uniref:Cyclin-L1 n=1 Tax=Ceratosolen solmsi marchali TaxID=326594 RepID=A0AAJ6YPX8_9HYME|nr:PREDICTED: cyclin-L1 [Ceratosolen solmsi marchali]XP_011502062.1 PREDICTED: cyclin-L1 [Ceratosolen solmsi marchali]
MGTKENSTTNAPKVAAPTHLKPYGKILLTLQNCLLPDEKLNSTPSSIDGLDAETETDLRILGCELIQTAGILLRLPQVAMATGQVIFQRFYYSKSLVRHNMETTAMACVCLASKIEEAPRHIRDVINVFNHIKQVGNQKAITPVILDQNYVALKNQVIKSERRVLKELGFCVHVKHPHKIIVMYLQVLGYEKNKALMQQCWNYMNDSLRSDVFIRYEPETVACACVYLGARQLQLPLPSSPSWFSLFKVTEASIRDICRRILRLYSRSRVKPEQLEKRVEELRKQYEEARIKARSGEVDGHTPSPPLPKQYNAWGGFISKSGTHAVPERVKSPKRSKSTSLSPARVDILKHSKRKKRSRSRSRSHSRTRKLKKTQRRRSGSHKTSRTRYRSRSRSRERDPEKSNKHRSKHRRH